MGKYVAAAITAFDLDDLDLALFAIFVLIDDDFVGTILDLVNFKNRF